MTKIIQNKGSLENCHSLAESKETWQIKLYVILDGIWNKKKDFG